ncbi:hypothetical protein [Oceanibaculum nanhaiense]|uniref:hypothetical protein n=1 Tax=Oceanibaculum nanhaiense TaxID=1909734 RepID=UPI003D2A94D3
MSNESVATLGEVEIELDGETVTLKPTYGATTRIEKRFGGWQGAVQAAAAVNTETLAFIVQQGLGLKDSDYPRLREAVWRSGAMDLTGPVIRYLRILANGGKPLDEDGDSTAEDPEKNGDSVH